MMCKLFEVRFISKECLWYYPKNVPDPPKNDLLDFGALISPGLRPVALVTVDVALPLPRPLPPLDLLVKE